MRALVLASALGVLTATGAALAACASASPSDASAVAATSSSKETAAPVLQGRYAFVFEESEVFAGMKTKCAADASGDAAKSA